MTYLLLIAALLLGGCSGSRAWLAGYDEEKATKQCTLESRLQDEHDSLCCSVETECRNGWCPCCLYGTVTAVGVVVRLEAAIPRLPKPVNSVEPAVIRD